MRRQHVWLSLSEGKTRTLEPCDCVGATIIYKDNPRASARGFELSRECGGST